MRSTITLNGINSNTIEGLLIQSLPPISKPLMRTQIEEIEGRDGDIITKLGFSAYNKEITIGLYGDFDINQIISYFTSEGTVIFSNEPDKYYNYQIVDQIDFERLIRYRTATVTMHCQPFKYSTTEGTEIFSPSSNLLSFDDFTQTTNGVTLTASDGKITISGTPTTATEFYLPLDGVSLAAGSYTLSATTNGTNDNYVSMRMIGSRPADSDSFGGKYITFVHNNTISLSATLDQSKTYGYLWFYMNAGTALNFDLTVRLENAEDAKISGEGSLIALQNTALAPFSKFDLKGDTTQQTYSGKNLIGDLVSTGTNNGLTTTINSDGSISVSGKSTTTYATLTVAKTVNIPNNTKVTFSVKSNTSNMAFGVILYDTGYTNRQNLNIQSGRRTATFTTNSAKSIAVLWASSLTANTDYNYTFEEVQFEISASATPYEPYVGGIPAPNPDYPQEVQVVTGEQTVTITDGQGQSQEYEVDLGSIELCKIGNYQDYIYKSGDDWYVHKEIGKEILTGAAEENWDLQNSGTTHWWYRLRYTVGFDENTLPVSTHFIGATVSSATESLGIWCLGSSSTTGTVRIREKTQDTVANFKSWLASHNVTVYGVLLTPTDTKITDTALIEQLNALVTTAHAYKGTTNLESTSENIPHIMSVEVAKDTNATITNSGNTTAKPTLTIFGSGVVGIYLNGYQIFTVNIGDNGYITIDTFNMEAYKDTTDNLMNRLVDGDYSNFALQTGDNQITFSGTVTKLEISNYSRWI